MEGSSENGGLRSIFYLKIRFTGDNVTEKHEHILMFDTLKALYYGNKFGVLEHIPMLC